MGARGEVLVAIMNNPLDFAIARDQHWYRIPVHIRGDAQSCARHRLDCGQCRGEAFQGTIVANQCNSI